MSVLCSRKDLQIAKPLHRRTRTKHAMITPTHHCRFVRPASVLDRELYCTGWLLSFGFPDWFSFLVSDQFVTTDASTNTGHPFFHLYAWFLAQQHGGMVVSFWFHFVITTNTFPYSWVSEWSETILQFLSWLLVHSLRVPSLKACFTDTPQKLPLGNEWMVIYILLPNREQWLWKIVLSFIFSLCVNCSIFLAGESKIKVLFPHSTKPIAGYILHSQDLILLYILLY